MRDNTRKSYLAAIEHFEVSWCGFFPATANSVARYLVDKAGGFELNLTKVVVSIRHDLQID
ncbi:MAG: hypothetical protein WCY88_07585 [Spongiibacteraceae bacterium]